MIKRIHKVLIASVVAIACIMVVARPVPSAVQMKRIEIGIERYGIVHWGLNTYTDREWGYGDEDPAMLNPAKFDADQVVCACKAGGLQGLIIVAKHHDGFCLWPTKTTTHNISRSPFRGGKGNYVKEMEQACRRAGLKFGVYVSPWDRNNAAYGTEKYVADVFQAQIRELLNGNYGEIFEMWFDGANGGDGYYGGAREKRKIPSGYYRYGTETFAMVRKLQPSVCIFNEMDEADFRFGGNERGLVDPDSRSTIGHYDGIWDHYKHVANVGAVDGTTFHPIEADVPLRPGWFYHEKERGQTKSAAYLMKLYLSSVGNAATMNIGIAPNRDGLLDDEDVKALKGFGDLLKIFFSREAKDGELFNVLVMQEDVSKGELVDGWKLAVDGQEILSGKSIGIKRIRTLADPIAGKVELKVSSTSGEKLGNVSVACYFVDPDLLKTVLSSTTDSGETDTAKWMTAAAPSNSNGRKVSFGGRNGEEFLVDGHPVQIRAGELEPQRIPREYWRHRIQMCKAMGLNAIASYFAWNDFEQGDGSFDFKTGNRDVAAFLSLCKEEGMWVLFRPGPFICAEWDFGGLPPRLLAKDMEIRSSDPRYLAEAGKYLSAIAEIAEPFLAKNGGPIVLTQIENEYGSWPFKKDKEYLRWLKDFWKARGFGPFYMADGAGDRFLKDLIYPDREIAVGFDPAMNDTAWSFARKYNPGVPVLSAETYPGWLRHWGEGNWKPSDLRKTVRWFMEGRRSFCLFVAHGGTSFGFTAGANDGGEGGYEPDLTSYDYGSPIDEQGRPTKAYFDYRAIIFDALGATPPPVPDAIASMSFDPVVPARVANLRNGLLDEMEFARPPYFEALGQNQGMAIYRTTLPPGDAAALSFDRVADYAQVWLGGRRIATIDRRKKSESIAIPARTAAAELEVVVEAMGHINFGKGMKYDRKGIVGDVKVDGKPLENWRVALKPLSEKSIADAKPASYDGYAGGHFRAALKLDKVADTYIDMSKWRKGTIYVNGYNLGRYWSVGPQYSLYCPAPFLRKGDNEIDIVELELAEPKPIQGLPRPLVRASEVDTENAANVW